jgi:hypothetical protein
VGWRGDDAAGGFLRPSLSRAGRDTAHLLASRLLVGAALGLITTFVAFVVTGNPAAWLALLSYPVFVFLAYLGLLVANWVGWNRVWRFEQTIAAGGSSGYQLNLWLRPKTRVVEYWTPDVDCRVYPPGGSPYTVAQGRFHRGSFWISYPDLFATAPPVVAGQYKIEWLVERRPGKWREIATHRMKVDIPPPVEPSSPGPVSSADRRSPRSSRRDR